VQPSSRKKLAGQLYYRLLEKLIRFEQHRLGAKAKTSLAALLTHERFHRSLLACCVEIVIVCYKMAYQFPWVAGALSLQPFDLYKIIETVLRHEPDTPRAVVRHLNAIEQSVLQQMAWSATSPVWAQLVATPLTRALVDEICASTVGAPATLTSGVAAQSAAAAVASLATLLSSSSQLSNASSDDSAGRDAPPDANPLFSPPRSARRPAHSLLVRSPSPAACCFVC
jgi:hypothetical protein